MDHVPRSHHPTLKYPRVPLLCKDLTKDVQFLSYPRAAGWEKLAPTKGTPVPFINEITDQNEIARLETFLQEWGFFGLLREALDPFGLFITGDYLDTDDQGQCVHTTRLNTTLESIPEIAETWSMDRKIEVGDHLEQCMRSVNNVLAGLVAAGAHDKMHPGIWMSLISICETIHGICDLHLARSPESIAQTMTWTSPERLPLSRSFELARLSECGWCPSDVTSCESAYSSTHARMYIRGVSRDDLGQNHSDCTADVCHKMQIDLSSYRPRHVHEQCTCKLIGPDKAAVAACLQEGKFPLLRINVSVLQEPSIKVVPFEGHEPFVALSHVWADGLGNPGNTVLPCCQLISLRKLIEEVRRTTFTWGVEGSDAIERRQEKRDLLFWCDTLCCPTVTRDAPTRQDVELKALAIAKLRDVYERAEYVLVLDQSLRRVESGTIDHLEHLVRILTCRWIKRLWTFQEAALSKKLLFAFADGIIDFRELWQCSKDLYEKSPTHRAMCRFLTWQCVSLKSWIAGVPVGGSTINRLYMAISHRRVSVPSDEPICIATALGLDVSAVSKMEADRRMELAWRLLFATSEGVPDVIIFNTLPRLSTPGYRWAPSSFQRPYSATRDMMVWNRNVTKASLTPDGIIVRRSGWQIEVGWPHVGAETMEQHFAQEFSESFHIRLANGHWYIAQGKDVPNGVAIPSLMGLFQTYRSRQWVMIFHDEMNQGQCQQALLAVSEDDGHVHRSICILQVQRLTPYIETFHELGYQYSEMMKREYPRAGYASMISLERMARMLVAWLPEGHERVPLPSIQSTIPKSQQQHAVDMGKLFEKFGQKAAETPEAQDALREARGRASPEVLRFHVMRAYFDGYARATEVYDESRSWCID